MYIVSCGDSFTTGQGLEKKSQAYPYLLSKDITNLAQSGASEYLITTQIEQAVKLKPDLIIVGHTSEYRWHVWDYRREMLQGFLVANYVLRNEKYYKNWIFSEQLLATRRKTEKHQTAWHAAGMLYFSDEDTVKHIWAASVAKQIILAQRAKIPLIHHCCFPHLQSELETLTDDYIEYHLDLEKHTDFAPDGSHAGTKSHKKLADLIKSKLPQNL
jgi:hypothetical protein